MSDEFFIAFDEDCLNVNFFKQMVNMSCEYVSILQFKLFLFIGFPIESNCAIPEIAFNELLPNNCSAKQDCYAIILYRQFASKSLWKV
jgi:hypothetical protein